MDFLLFSCGVQAPGRVGSVVCGTRALVEARELSSCGAGARPPRRPWDLSFLTKDRTRVPCIIRQTLHPWTTREVPQLCIYKDAHYISKYFVAFLFLVHRIPWKRNTPNNLKAGERNAQCTVVGSCSEGQRMKMLRCRCCLVLGMHF